MRSCLPLLLVLFTLGTARAQSTELDLSDLYRLYEEKKCFELRDAAGALEQSADPRSLFYRGAAAYFAFDTELSNRLLGQFLEKSSTDESALLRRAHGLLAANALRVGAYQAASDHFSTLLARFGADLEASEVTAYRNIKSLTDQLRNSKPPEIEVLADTFLDACVPGEGWHLPLTAGAVTVPLLIDTGANFSLLSESFAAKLGVVYVGDGIEVGTVNTKVVQPRLAVLPESTIGNVSLKNTVFLVLDDETLTLPDGTLLKGVLGFPALSGLKEITFRRNGEVFISKEPRFRAGESLSLDGFDILIQGEVKGRNLSFQLDSGARTSILYQLYYWEFKDEIEAGSVLTAENVIGLGGSEGVPVYRIDDFEIALGGHEVEFAEIFVATRSLSRVPGRTFGLLGQDFMARFESLTLNFQTMTLSVE